MRDLVETPDGATYFAERVWGATSRYDLGPGHPLVGRSAPDLEFGDGRRLADSFRTGEGLLLEFGADTLRAQASGWKGRIAYASQGADQRFGLSAALVRPDGIVAWASEATPSGEELQRAATRWFGEPRTDDRGVALPDSPKR